MVVVVLSSDAQADLDALRRTGRGALADRADELIQRLAAAPAGHRIEGTQRSIEGFGGRVGAGLCGPATPWLWWAGPSTATSW